MLLEVKNLCKNYRHGKEQITVLDNINFSLERGEFVTIMGASGSGKTTLLNMIAGLITPTKGRITVDSTNLFELDDDLASAFRNQHIGYIPQGDTLLPILTGLENIQLPCSLYQRSLYQHCKNVHSLDPQKLLKKAKVSHLSELYPADMSTSEMRRLAILRAYICEPQLILADEPTNGLDEESINEIMQLLININIRGVALLIVTHDNSVARYCKRNLMITKGKLTTM
ncbi:ABC transporter ATP-binding protein [Orbaceae bacterium ESL0721]|nr:ABC transporter ATP-binding protein [Orbaceae bacterium ESL0721]